MKWKPYPEYKESGIELPKTIPSNWTQVAIRRLLEDGQDGIKIGPFGSALKLEIMQRCGWKVYGQEHIISGDFSMGDKYISDEKFEELKACSTGHGDLLVTMMGSAGKCKVVPEEAEIGIMDSHLLRLRLRETKVLPYFAALLIDQSQYIETQLDMMGKGSIMQGLNSSIIKDLRFIVPPIEEQRYILSCLDHETEHIDNLIAKKQRQIELLQEKRSAFIGHVVTKGLKPEVKMKDSGVEWLPKIPEHWILVSLRRKLQPGQDGIKFGPFGSDLKLEMMQEYGWKVYGQEHIISGDFTLGTQYVGNDKFKELENCSTRPGDILITTMGTTGHCKVLPNTASVGLMGSHLLRIRVKESEILPDFIVMLIDQAPYIREQINQLGKGAIMQGLNSSIVKNLQLLIPTISEQNEILEILNIALAKIDNIIANIQISITKLKEYRSTLISAAVTGKIDMRQEAT